MKAKKLVTVLDHSFLKIGSNGRRGGRGEHDRNILYENISLKNKHGGNKNKFKFSKIIGSNNHSKYESHINRDKSF